MIEYKILHLFSGIGGGALGFQQAQEEWKGLKGSFRTLAGIDCDPEACEDFEKITGVPAACMDLFSRQQYIDFHGLEPPEEWREVMPEDIRAATKGEYPDVIFTSPPCKGFSGLLPEKSAKSKKYQALNELVIRGLFLTLEAYRDILPGIILLENVPRITSRGAKLLHQVKTLLGQYGYLFSEGYHDCGEIGGLGQRRKRYLLIARLPEKVTAFVYEPPKYPLKTIGDIIGPLPMPDDPKAGTMHRLPRLQWKTWVRLALIPAGGDWRDLEDLTYSPRNGAYRIAPWDETSNTVTGTRGVGRSNGAAAVADPRITCKQRNGTLGVVRWDEQAPTVSGNGHIGNSTASVADPRVKCHPRSGSYGVQAWDEPGKTVIGAGDIHAGAAAIADPRIPKETENGVWVIVSEDGTWHRPLTTLEMAALQSFPVTFADGSPLVLAGNSDARWRERIGNAVPPAAGKAIGETVLRALLPSEKKAWVMSFNQGLTKDEISRRLGCSIYLLYDRLRKGDVSSQTMVCEFCGREYQGNNSRKTCGREECQREYAKKYNRERAKQNYSYVKAAEREVGFTPTLDRMIVEDLCKGRSVAWIANMYNRPKKDIQARVEWLKADGRIDRLRCRLSEYARRA